MVEVVDPHRRRVVTRRLVERLILTVAANGEVGAVAYNDQGDPVVEIIRFYISAP